MSKYILDSNDYDRRKYRITDIKNIDAHLIKPHRKLKFPKVIGILMGLAILVSFVIGMLSGNYLMLESIISLSGFISAIIILEYNGNYEIQYDATKEILVIKRLYKTIIIPKNKLKQIYVGQRLYTTRSEWRRNEDIYRAIRVQTWHFEDVLVPVEKEYLYPNARKGEMELNICFFDKNYIEKVILLNIYGLKQEEIKEFLDIFII